MKRPDNTGRALLSVVIPALNEENRLPATLDALAEYQESHSFPIEVIVVDDGSTDNTGTVARSHGEAFSGFRLLRHERNHGKGYAVREGVLAAEGDFILFMDADSATPITELDKLWPAASEYPVVIGSRLLHGANVVIKQPWHRVFISRLGNALIRGLVIRMVKDTQCGFKLFQAEPAREIFRRQKIHGWGFDVEILAIANHELGYPIKEVPVSWYDSRDSRLRPVRDAWKTLRELVRIKWYLLSGAYRPPLDP